jgi:hypothetical protein
VEETFRSGNLFRSFLWNRFVHTTEGLSVQFCTPTHSGESRALERPKLLHASLRKSGGWSEREMSVFCAGFRNPKALEGLSHRDV